MAEYPFKCYVVQSFRVPTGKWFNRCFEHLSFHMPTGKLLGPYHRAHWGEHYDRHHGSVNKSFERRHRGDWLESILLYGLCIASLLYLSSYKADLVPSLLALHSTTTFTRREDSTTTAAFLPY